MNAELQEMKDAVNGLNETMRSSMKTFRLVGGSEDVLLDMLEGDICKIL